MLAKELKIKTLKKQRKFIKDQLSHADAGNDGNTAYRYAGHVYPEVIKYFESEGFVVTQVHSELLTALANGMPVYLFAVGDVELSEEELEQSEAYEPETPDDDFNEEMPDFMKDLMSGVIGIL